MAKTLDIIGVVFMLIPLVFLVYALLVFFGDLVRHLRTLLQKITGILRKTHFTVHGGLLWLSYYILLVYYSLGSWEICNGSVQRI